MMARYRIIIFLIVFPFDEVACQTGNDLSRPIQNLANPSGLLPTNITISNPLDRIKNADSILVTGLQNAAGTAFNQIKNAAQASLSTLRYKKNLLPGMPKIDAGAIAALKRFRITNPIVGSTANYWESDSSNSLYWQNSASVEFNALGLPLAAEVLYLNNFAGQRQQQRFIYKINFSKTALMQKLGLNSRDLKGEMHQQLDFAKQVDYKAIITNTFNAVPGVNQLIQSTGCNWEHLLQMPAAEFSKLYNKEALQQKLADAKKLQDYYQDYLKKSADSLVQSRAAKVDSQLTALKQQSGLYDKLMTLKQQADALQQKIAQLRQLYEEKIKLAMDGYNTASQMIKNNGDLSGLQKFMSKVKGLQIGQHTLSTGNLALQNFLQNGVSFEYETDRSFLLLTKGSQAQLEYPGFFPQNTITPQDGVNGYYQVFSRYRLTGVSVGRGNREGNYQQVSLMNFNKVTDENRPAILAKTVNVVTVSNQFVKGGQKLLLDLSKSIVKQDRGTAPPANFWDGIAVNVKYEYRNSQTQEKQKLGFFYNANTYNNPGLNGGINRPGFLLDYGLTKLLGKRFRLMNQLAWYSFKYGNSFSLRSVRNRLDLSYKIKKMRIGMMVNGSYANQLQYNPKVVYNTRSLDVLATGQMQKRVGRFDVAANGGAGYGFNQQEQFNKVKDYSFFANTTVGYKNWTLDVSADRFNTRNTEVFLRDSVALAYIASFNLQAALGYTNSKGDFLQAGLLYRKLNDNAQQFFITAATEWRLFNRVAVGGNLNLPLASPANQFFINNIFNAKLTYNINGYDK